MTNNELRNQIEDLAFAVIEFGDQTQDRQFAAVYRLASKLLTDLALHDAMIEQDEEEGTLQ